MFDARNKEAKKIYGKPYKQLPMSYCAVINSTVSVNRYNWFRKNGYTDKEARYKATHFNG